ncbi:MAG: hypothetical protein IT384_22575 [Deltaproteobacteria bacterium]|nr:hypothetical protein [Deltaproteobacteria bacterium]
MAPPKKPAGAGKEPAAPWSARNVRGVTPPGRRVSPEGTPRRARWSASGVEGVAAPGTQEPGEGAVAEWLGRKTKPKKRRGRKGEAVGPGRPTAGFVPSPDAGADDPANLKIYVDQIIDFFRAHPPDDATSLQLGQLIAQSHAPFEILIGFAVLTAYAGNDNARRRKHQWALERGAKVFYNLSKRLDPSVRPPRGLVPRTVDPLFYDLPRTALQIPYAYATDAFLRVLELLRIDHNYDRRLIAFARELRARDHEARTFGDRALVALFPWEEPAWAD